MRARLAQRGRLCRRACQLGLPLLLEGAAPLSAAPAGGQRRGGAARLTGGGPLVGDSAHVGEAGGAERQPDVAVPDRGGGGHGARHGGEVGGGELGGPHHGGRVAVPPPERVCAQHPAKLVARRARESGGRSDDLQGRVAGVSRGWERVAGVSRARRGRRGRVAGVSQECHLESLVEGVVCIPRQHAGKRAVGVRGCAVGTG